MTTLETSGYRLSVVRERPTFVEAEVRKGDDAVIVQWPHDSAYRFFPLVKHDELGLVLHPFDLVTSKVLLSSVASSRAKAGDSGGEAGALA